VSEKWMPITGYEGWYEVSNFGRVRRVKPGHGTFIGRILKPRALGAKYQGVYLRKNDKGTNKYIHCLVAEAFICARPDNMEVNHIDGDKNNNSVKNLEYVTRAENMAHGYRAGLISNRGERCGTSKLTESDVHKIRKLLKTETQKAIAINFGVSRSTIYDIFANRTWFWLKERI